MSDSDWTILECPECKSTRAGFIRFDPPRAKCSDCGYIYDIAAFPQADERKATPGLRRRDNGPPELAVDPVPPPDPQELGTLTRYTQEILAGGPGALIAAEHKAAELSQKFGEGFEAQWCLTTPYLQSLANGIDPAKPDAPITDAENASSAVDVVSAPDAGENGHTDNVRKYNYARRNRARARYALMWRPKFLAILALTHSVTIACRMVKVARNTVCVHRRNDPDFEAQWEAAGEHAIQLLHDVTMKSAIEGELEPVYWQGIEVGHIRKIDNRLRIEMLRAHMPQKFKTPEAKVGIVTGDGSQNMIICGPKERETLIAARRATLERMAKERGLPCPGTPEV